MPIYEFYCRKCNTVYNFFSRTADTDKVPFCPRCKRVRLKRQMSVFAKVSGKREEGAETDAGMPPIDEDRMEKAMAMLAGEADRISEDDPRQAAALMRKLSDATGLNLGPGMEEALRRLEAWRRSGPDRGGDRRPSGGGGAVPVRRERTRGEGRKKVSPRVDETLYEL
jgi:putative FmdB family regulatory protein